MKLKLIFLCSLMIQAKIVLGCFCITPEDSFKRADVIFTGIANIDSNYVEEANCYFGLDGWVEFEVDTIIKGGELRSHLENCKKIVILQGSTNCYFSFQQDSAYVVYAQIIVEKEDLESFFPFLTTSQCTGTNKIHSKEISSHESSSSSNSLHQAEKSLTFPYQQIGLFCSMSLNAILLFFLMQMRRKVKQKSR